MVLPEPFAKRVSEADVVRVLRLVAETPNRRKKPTVGDIAGQFDYWFDGGACRYVTGVTYFELNDGTRCSSAVSPQLSFTIRFPDGREVSIHQRAPDDRS